MRALIVDDSRFVRGYVRSLLEAKGIECEEAGDGQAALELVLAGQPFDVALVDWNMPVMSGVEFTRHLRARPDGQTVPILMVTTRSSREDIVAAVEAGVNNYILKPFTPQVLKEKIELLLQDAVAA